MDRLQNMASWLGVDVAGKDRQELIDACCKVVKDMNDSLGVPTPKIFGCGSREDMEKGYNATWTNEQGMLGVAGVTDPDELHTYFESNGMKSSG